MRFKELSGSAEEDKYREWDRDDTRRPRLTLSLLNKMRNARNMAKAEHATQVETWNDMYARGGEE